MALTGILCMSFDHAVRAPEVGTFRGYVVDGFLHGGQLFFELPFDAMDNNIVVSFKL